MRTRTRALPYLVASALAACAGTRGPAADESDGAGLARYFERSLVARAEPVIRRSIAERVYYYTVSPCCDLFNPLYDAAGKYVCSPDGGFTGRGDGQCPAEVRAGASTEESVPNPFYRR